MACRGSAVRIRYSPPFVKKMREQSRVFDVSHTAGTHIEYARRMEHKKNKRKSDFLGQPLGTASHRLRKMIMFSMAQRLGEDACFKCGEKIESLEEFTIEHKQPWLHESIDLFFDLSNIAFSHTRCNRTDRPAAWKQQCFDPDRAWCRGCKKTLPRNEFYVNRTKKVGVQSDCKACHSRQSKDWPRRKQP